MKLLLAVDHSESTTKAVSFVGRLCGPRTAGDLQVTLFHVTEELPEFIVSRQKDDAAYERVAKDWTENQRQEGEQLLARLRASLVGSGIPDSAIVNRLVTREGLPESRRVIAALAIVEELKSGGHDVVVLGRRSTSAAVGSFPGSIAEKVTREAIGKTVFIVD